MAVTSISRSRRNPLMKVAAAAALTASLLGSTHGPATAAPAPSDSVVLVPTEGTTGAIISDRHAPVPVELFAAEQSFTGHFNGDGLEDVFLYNPRSGRDAILSMSHVAPPAVRDVTVGGNYRPLVGKFSVPNDTDDILWYAPGPAPDYLWSFNADGTYRTTTLSVGGTFEPVVGEFSSAGQTSPDSILWYAPGSGADYLWTFDAAGNPASKRLNVGGDQRPLVGEFHANTAAGYPGEQIIWWDETGPDYMWSFATNGTPSTRALPNIGAYSQAVVGSFDSNDFRDGVFFYAPGSNAERRVGFTAAGAMRDHRAGTVNGTYRVSVADTNGDDYDDIIFNADGAGYIWRTAGDPSTQVRFSTDVGPSRAHGVAAR